MFARFVRRFRSIERHRSSRPTACPTPTLNLFHVYTHRVRDEGIIDSIRSYAASRLANRIKSSSSVRRIDTEDCPNIWRIGGCSNSIWRARDNVSPRRRKIKRLIGRDVWIFGIGGRFERGDDGWSKRGLNAWRTYASTGSRGAYLSILRGSICVVRQTGNTGGNYHPDPKCSRTSPRVSRGWKADRANWQSRSRACTCPVAAM